MLVVLRRYAPGARASEVARRVGEDLVPILTRLPGFRAYYCFVGEDGRPVSVSIVESRAAAVVANERARKWVAAKMADLVPDPRDVAMREMPVDAATHDDAAGRDVPHDALDRAAAATLAIGAGPPSAPCGTAPPPGAASAGPFRLHGPSRRRRGASHADLHRVGRLDGPGRTGHRRVAAAARRRQAPA